MNQPPLVDYAGKYLRDYEGARYTFWERNLQAFDVLRSIIVPAGAEQFADFSFYQVGMNWDEYATHARAAILRISQGTWEDSELDTNYAATRRLNILTGGYVFFDGRYSPQQQAQVVINAVKGKTFELEIFVDWERNYQGAYEGLPNVVKLMQLLEVAGVACKAIGLYTGYYYFMENSNATANATQYTYLKACPLWLAWYASEAVVKVPPPWSTWTHWQFGTPAVYWGQPTKEIDMNKHNGTSTQFTERYGASVPPTEGGSMSVYKVVSTVSFRSSSSTASTSNLLGTLNIGDLLTGVLITGVNDPVTQWIHFTTLQRVSGQPQAVDAYCSGYPKYVELQAAPPPADSVTIDIALHDLKVAGDVYEAKGVKAVKVA